jgi:hypothetical protein
VDPNGRSTVVSFWDVKLVQRTQLLVHRRLRCASAPPLWP